ncbi:ABC transporter substrate-binding protein [Saccharibacillus sp. O23]|uniref:extracellular solute-binding protein n=1 Tax=Saccharibacillus sp. O23 TaxID=2009338 RepID=UPI000B4E5A76|nr:extracellular solute-binding protein [Saccharibacillus sp. O23]OWR27695.1 ABC transporter substrate-binding protein [Saccharibacillus sp. O23]
MKLWKTKSTAALGLLLLTFTTACGNGSGQPTAQASTDSAASNKTTATAASTETASTETAADAKPAAGEEITVYLNDFDAVIGDMFEKKTGYKLNVVVGNGAEIMSRVEAEKGNPQWDVLWIDSMPSVNGLDRQGQLLQGWTPDNAGKLKDQFEAQVPEDKAYYPTGAHAAGVLVYNTKEIAEADAPKSWADLTKDVYKDRIGTADPAIAAPAYPFVSWFFENKGMESGEQYFGDLMKNGMRVYPKNPQVAQALTSGEVDVAMLQETNAYSLVNDGEPVKIVWPAEGAPGSVRVAAIQKDTKHAAVAKEFVNFLLDPQVQQQLIDEGDESYFEPSAEGAKTKPDREPNAKLNIADAAWASEHEAEIKQWFADQAIQ